MSDRYMAEAQKRENLLHNEQESRLREEQKKQELMQQVRSLTPSFPYTFSLTKRRKGPVNIAIISEKTRRRDSVSDLAWISQRLAEYEKIGKARKAELQRQEDLLTQKHLR